MSLHIVHMPDVLQRHTYTQGFTYTHARARAETHHAYTCAQIHPRHKETRHAHVDFMPHIY